MVRFWEFRLAALRIYGAFCYMVVRFWEFRLSTLQAVLGHEFGYLSLSSRGFSA